MSSKKRSRITNQEPFLPLGSDAFSGKKRTKPPKHHQLHQKLVPSSVSSRILKEAIIQQKEIEHEEDDDNNKVSEQNPESKLVLPQFHGLKDKDDEEDVDDFDGFSETQSRFGRWDPEDEIDEEDEKLLEAFLSKDNHSQRTLTDVIVKKIKENDAQVSGVQPMPKLDDTIIELYKGRLFRC
ncbi:hypothetical protein CASFOL_017180 [Castilleja foliolosa]|uniref:Bystin n=1 Tax=Castilleja foliolosa TaxID=1961234 RepID=A0ABD3DAU5_9LAMI